MKRHDSAPSRPTLLPSNDAPAAMPDDPSTTSRAWVVADGYSYTEFRLCTDDGGGMRLWTLCRAIVGDEAGSEPGEPTPPPGPASATTPDLARPALEDSPMNANTTLVTVTYGDRLGYLQQLVERSLLFPQIARIIIVSNASSAPLEQLCQRWPDQVRVIRLAHNTGSANGYAVAIEAALEEGADYIWMMDDDNAPTPAAVEILHRELRTLTARHGSAHAAVLGFRATQQADVASGVPERFVTNPRSSYFGFHVRQLPYKVWRRLPWGKPRGLPPMSIGLPYAPYGGMLAHHSLYRRIGVPRRDLVLYADDTEYTRRITADGGELRLYTEAVIEELEQSWNIKARTSNVYETYLLGDSEFRAYYAARNQAWFDRHVWSASPLMYRINRGVFLALLRLFALRRHASERLALLRRAMQEGEQGTLGMNERFPLR